MGVELIDILPLDYLQAMIRQYPDGNFMTGLAEDVADIRAKIRVDEDDVIDTEIYEVDCGED
jgi:hypothetical protein